MTTISQWYPSPCTDRGCKKNHAELEDTSRFHAGVYIQIKGCDRYRVCTKAIKDREIIPLPIEKFSYSEPGVIDVRVFSLDDRRNYRFFDFPTNKFPQILRDIKEVNLSLDLKPLLKEATELLEISKTV